MDIVNSFLRTLSTDARGALWWGFILVSAIVLSLLQYYYGRKNGHQAARSIAIISFAAFCVLAVITYAVDFVTNGLIFPSGSTYFVPYLLMATFVLNKMLQIPFFSALDQTAVANVLARAVTVTGCSFAGCCQGYPVSWGIYTAIRGETAVPIRMIEQVFLVALWFYLNKYYQKHGYHTNGKCASIAMIIFGLINLISDIFTIEEKLFYMTSVEGVAAFLTVCAGLILLYIVDKKKTQESSVATDACTN